ncbi:MAG: thioredoxin domain-containing protein, partial [Candidatus Pacebacteria bacterium]|nr:thioredoxin domain-containing protein [Candidatus Paceibacterota bacterium]
IDETEFTAKITDTVYSDFVQLDAKVGTQIGIQATPTFFVNGQQTAAPQLRDEVAKVLAK